MADVETVPLDDDARDGRYQLVEGGGHFALARWHGDRWIFSSGAELPFTPTHYHPGNKDRAA